MKELDALVTIGNPQEIVAIRFNDNARRYEFYSITKARHLMTLSETDYATLLTALQNLHLAVNN